MKNVSLLYTGFCLLFFQSFFISCEEDEKEKLPPITMEGKNTFGCLVNGNAWLSIGALGQDGTYAELQTSGDTTAIIIYADNMKRNDGLRMFFYDLPTLQADKVYDLTNSDFHVEYRKRSDGDKVLCTYDEALTGIVTVLKFDTNYQIISGIFEFKSYTIDCNDTVIITNGRFDLLYNR